MIPVMVGSFALGAVDAGIGWAVGLGVLITVADVSIQGYLNVINHVPVSMGSYVLYIGHKALDYIGMATLFYGMGHELYEWFHSDKATLSVPKKTAGPKICKHVDPDGTTQYECSIPKSEFNNGFSFDPFIQDMSGVRDYIASIFQMDVDASKYVVTYLEDAGDMYVFRLLPVDDMIIRPGI